MYDVTLPGRDGSSQLKGFMNFAEPHKGIPPISRLLRLYRRPP